MASGTGVGLTLPQDVLFGGNADHGQILSLTRLDSGPTMEDTLNSQGWRLGLLVARNVTVAEKMVESGPGKISPLAFAVGAGMTDFVVSAKKTVKDLPVRFRDQVERGSANTIIKYLMCWNKASWDGLVPHSTELVPEQNVEFDDRHSYELWIQYLQEFDKTSDFPFTLDERHTAELWEQCFSGQNSCVYFIGHEDRPDLPVKIGKA